MAEDTIDKAIEVHQLKKVASKTKDLSIHGNIPAKDVDRSNHLYIYGSDIPAIKALQQENRNMQREYIQTMNLPLLKLSGLSETKWLKPLRMYWPEESVFFS